MIFLTRMLKGKSYQRKKQNQSVSVSHTPTREDSYCFVLWSLIAYLTAQWTELRNANIVTRVWQGFVETETNIWIMLFLVRVTFFCGTLNICSKDLWVNKWWQNVHCWVNWHTHIHNKSNCTPLFNLVVFF